jgi:hypothetical protein
VRPEDRPAYILALQEAQGGGGVARFNRLLFERLDATLSDYLTALREALPASTSDVAAPKTS